MKHFRYLFALLGILFLANTAHTQAIPDSVYYQRLFHTCKVWGYVKYFHTAMEDCSINWDSVLVNTLPQIQSAQTNQDFKDILYNMVMAPGEMGIPSGPPPNIPDSLFFNLHLDWFNDTALSQAVTDALDTIRVRFRPQDNCYVYPTAGTGQPNFSYDDEYYILGSYPDSNLRILSLFRYWNIIEYFFPYTDIMDQEWDVSLEQMIPYFYEASDGTEYGLAVLRVVHLINDTHGFTNANQVYSYFGGYFPRLWARQADDKMVVVEVHETVTNIFPGDIILKVDGVGIEHYKDSLRPYIAASNESRMQMNLNNNVLRGQYGEVEMFLQNENGTRLETTDRNWSTAAWNQFFENTGPVWYDTTLPAGCNYGYVDMGRLAQNDVDDMFDELWETDAIVFDIRSYPQGTLWYIVNYIYPDPLYIANFTIPSSDYPGTIVWMAETIGYGNTNQYAGKLIVLFNEMTLSQAEYTCMGFDYHSECIKIGSQTAAADGNVTMVYLPGEITSYLTGLGTFYADYTQTQRIGIVPDHEVKPSVQGLREQRDEVLEYAMDCGFVGTEEPILYQEAKVEIYPVPATDYIYIESEMQYPLQVEFYDIFGKKVKELSLIEESRIDVRNLTKGIYMVRVVSDKFRVIGKIIVGE